MKSSLLGLVTTDLARTGTRPPNSQLETNTFALCHATHLQGSCKTTKAGSMSGGSGLGLQTKAQER